MFFCHFCSNLFPPSLTIPTETFFFYHKSSWWPLLGAVTNHEYRVIIALSSLDFRSSSYFLLIYIFIHLICSFLYLVSRQGFSVDPWLLWNFLCRPGCALPQRPSCLCSLVLGLKAFSTTARLGLYLNYHRWASAAAVLVRLIMDKENHFDIFSTAPYQKKSYLVSFNGVISSMTLAPSSLPGTKYQVVLFLASALPSIPKE